MIQTITGNLSKKVLWLLFIIIVLSTSIVALSETVSALSPGCYVTFQGETSIANCPQSDSSGANIDPAKCYFAAGSSQGVGTFSIQTCDQAVQQSSDRPGSSSNNCLTNASNCNTINTNQFDGEYQCGKEYDGNGGVVKMSINVGCLGDDYPRPYINPIIDMAFAFFRFLTYGVGLVLIGSIIFAGIQYSSSKGNPQAVEASTKRIINTVIALMLYIFLVSISNYIVPGGLFI